jgi:hypothetical protein
VAWKPGRGENGGDGAESGKMEKVLTTLLEAGPAYVLAAVLIFILAWDRRATRERDAARDKRMDEIADKLYEVAMKGIARDEQVHGTLEAVRRDVEEVRRRTYGDK